MKLNPSHILRGFPHVYAETTNFIDKDGKTGITIPGYFSSIEEIGQMCLEYDVWIHEIIEITDNKGNKSYRAKYGCRNKKVEKANPSNGLRRFK
jgi:hypothetical protein